ncbi:helix-turn-helix transcriptional regulator [Alkalicoccus daliensis]|uniref:Helix-turn-helix domain-containing protein n=1 Tax=Alkalicoccus daliensis TaxID=745820 RepID=A0A1H0HTQ2_9BACI|nr:helix-turn-helix transcriptional regulator [Alkalicoccus daliensis]SDO22470.1 Helix-turn-helix domain-containing protein [Alkalicoccus daliensis]
MNSEELGRTIAKVRKQKSMSQKQLAEGICTQGAISQIEKGTMVPKVDTLYFLALRLDAPLNYFIEVFIEPDYEERDKLAGEIESAARERQHEHIYQRITELYQTQDKFEISLSYYLRWFYTVSKFHTSRISAEEAIEKLRLLLQEGDDTNIRRHHLHLRIMNTLAYLYALEGSTKQSLYYQDKILQTQVITSSAANELDYDVFLIRVMYNKAKMLYDTNQISKSLEVIEQGVASSIEKENMSLLGQLYYYRGQCLEKDDGDEEEIKESYQRALLFFEILNKRAYSKLVWEHKEAFLV